MERLHNTGSGQLHNTGSGRLHNTGSGRLHNTGSERLRLCNTASRTNPSDYSMPSPSVSSVTGGGGSKHIFRSSLSLTITLTVFFILRLRKLGVYSGNPELQRNSLFVFDLIKKKKSCLKVKKMSYSTKLTWKYM